MRISNMRGIFVTSTKVAESKQIFWKIITIPNFQNYKKIKHLMSAMKNAGVLLALIISSAKNVRFR